MNKKEFFKERIDKIARESFNADQKELAKKIIDNTDDKDLDAVWGLISQRVKTGFVFDEAPEINHNCVAYIKENEKLGINVGKENTIEHSLIIGENYDALKNLVATYTNNQGKGFIDIIYIDPPYNTDKSKEEGNDYKEDIESKNKFIYRDKYTRDGWLNMMNERLELAKKLMSDAGVIFVSIDDSEQAYLKILMDDIFGEENFIANLVWSNKEGGGSSDSSLFKVKHEYILCYAKNKNRCNNIKNIDIEDAKRYTQKDEFVEVRGKYQLVKLSSASIQYSVSLDYPIECPDGTFVWPVDNSDKNRSCWRWGKKKLQWGLENKFIIIQKDKDNVWQVYTKQYTNCDNEGNIVERSKKPSGMIDMYSSTQGSNLLYKILAAKAFDYPKPVDLIKYLIDRFSKSNSIVLDFFAGSGTTGQAVMELNEEDGGNRKFILVTNNENDIATKITRERLYRVINGKGSKGEDFEWRYSKDKKNLPANSLRVFDIVKENLNITDIDKAEKIKKEAEINFAKLNPNYKTKSEFDIYNVLSSLTPYKNESED